MKLLLERGALAHDFLRDHTTGRAELEASLAAQKLEDLVRLSASRSRT